jgi:hypothetical protein
LKTKKYPDGYAGHWAFKVYIVETLNLITEEVKTIRRFNN